MLQLKTIQRTMHLNWKMVNVEWISLLRKSNQLQNAANLDSKALNFPNVHKLHVNKSVWN